MSSISTLGSLFNATSVAIVGVSSDESKIGSVILKNLIDGGYMGRIFPVNPKYETVRGIPCYPTVSAVPEDVELVCIAIPAAYVKDAVTDAIAKQVKAVVIISAGFSELGEAGHELERELVTMLNQAGIQLLGPNCLGFMNTLSNINLSFAAGFPTRGDIALFSQSGAICTALLDRAVKENLGFSHIVSVGNKAGIGELDLLNDFATNDGVKVIGAYLESMQYGRKVVEAYTQSNPRKPFVLIKPGVSDQAKKAIGSHTGSIAGSAKTFQTAMAQNGILQVDTIDDFYSLLQCFSWMKPVLGNRVAIVTNAGGPGILATDDVVSHGLTIANLSESTVAQLKEFLPAESSVKNPIDLLGDARSDRFAKAAEIICADENVDVVLVVMTPQFVTEIVESSTALVHVASAQGKPIVPIMLGGERMSSGVNVFLQNQQVVFSEISSAIERVAQLYAYYQQQVSPQLPIVPSIRAVTLPPVGQNPQILDSETTQQLLTSCDITTAKQQLCESLEEAFLWAEDNYPIVLKIPNEILVHKTEKRGVVVNIKTQDMLRQAWYELADTEKSITNANETKLLAQQQIKFEDELFVGANRDGSETVYEPDQPGFGHLLVFGKGGIYTELYKDYGYAVIPASQQTMLAALAQTKISRILTGLRNKEPLAVSKFVQLLQNVQQMLVTYPEIVSVDFNPILITADNVYAVDAKIFVG